METRYMVWSYMTIDEDCRPIRRTIFFYAGSQDYTGSSLRCTDSVWMVPDTDAP